MDEAEKWLKENDPLFEQRDKLEYKYHTHSAMDYIKRKEIPVSNVFSLGIRDVIA